MELEDFAQDELDSEGEAEAETGNLSPIGTYQPGMNWNPVEKIILERRSTRAFKPEPLPDGMIRRILEAGRFAPSAGNTQPWKYIVVKSPEIIAEMEKDSVVFAKRIMSSLDYTQDPANSELRARAKKVIKSQLNVLAPEPFIALQRIAAGKMSVFLNAPTLILILIDTRGAGEPKVDSGIAGENIVLAAHSMGAATCWIGVTSLLIHRMSSSARKWRRFFGIEFPYELLDVIALGWPKRRFDREVPREVQLVSWYEGGMNDPPRIDRQGDEQP
ncbi:MAG TPA: nitroreductase family protein [Candidatus Lokiarchaeia archaeon]|nr:nitroreductase family protein [Candidatus Lokiarchaeia archaeon]